MEQVTFAPSLY